jgi:hypothetical protein
MAIQWENFNGRDRGLIIDIEIMVEENGMSGWSWTISTEPCAVKARGEVKFHIYEGDDIEKQRALNQVLLGLEGEINDVLDDIAYENQKERKRLDREAGPEMTEDGLPMWAGV